MTSTLTRNDLIRIHVRHVTDILEFDSFGLADEGAFDRVVRQSALAPDTDHAAAEMLWGIITQKPFLCGNDGTALNAAVVTYGLNGGWLPENEAIKDLVQLIRDGGSGVPEAAQWLHAYAVVLEGGYEGF
jgi:prophage maintenance system killer protein